MIPGSGSTFSVGVLAALVVIAAGPGRPPAAATAPAQRVALEFAGVLEVSDGPAAILVLREKGARTVLPIILPDGGALTGHDRSHAPQGLLGGALQALGARVAEVEIEEAEETSSGACVRLLQAGKRIELHARPSESVALALAAGAPIVTSRRVIDEAGLTPEDIARVPDRDQGHGPIHL